MLAKRLIVAAFALVAIGLTPLVFAGERDLFVDLEPLPAMVASN
jgi:hypothetical protein